MLFDYSMLLIVLLCIAEVYGDFSLRFYAQTNKFEWLAHGITGYAGVLFFLVQSFKYNNVLYVNGLWDGVSGLIESLAAYYILGDRLEKMSEYIGILFIIVGIMLMKM